MKQTFFTMLLFLSAITATAQEQKSNEINEKYFNAKVSELVYRLDISDEQKSKFIPIYRKYNDEMRSVMGPRMKKKFKEGNKLTDEEKLARTKQRMERQQQAQAIRLKYIDEFSNVLSAQQVNKFYEVENKIQKKLMDRRKHHKNMKRKQFKNSNNDKKIKKD